MKTSEFFNSLRETLIENFESSYNEVLHNDDDSYDKDVAVQDLWNLLERAKNAVTLTEVFELIRVGGWVLDDLVPLILGTILEDYGDQDPTSVYIAPHHEWDT